MLDSNPDARGVAPDVGREAGSRDVGDVLIKCGEKLIGRELFHPRLSLGQKGASDVFVNEFGAVFVIGDIAPSAVMGIALVEGDNCLGGGIDVRLAGSSKKSPARPSLLVPSPGRRPRDR